MELESNLPLSFSLNYSFNIYKRGGIPLYEEMGTEQELHNDSEES